VGYGRLIGVIPKMTGGLLPLLLLTPLAGFAPDAPLPDPRQLKERALVSLHQSEKNLENYSCLVRAVNEELNGDGSVKRKRTKVVERFFVNGVQINHVIERDGQPLSTGESKKEQERVDQQVRKFSDRRNVEENQARSEEHIDRFLRALRFLNGYREQRQSRSVVVYDLSGDPDFHPRKVEERFAQALTGRIWMDEQSGTPLEVQVETSRDVKIGMGLLANVHKGFRLHLLQQRQPDGVWLTKMVEGSGDAKAALFLHPRFRFHEDLDQCHLFTVNSQEHVRAPHETP
jgi:hypothetical protein